jgi:hypothetical protein
MDFPDGFPATPAGRAEFVANIMDEAITIPVIDVSIGLDPILTLLPGPAGTIVGAIISVYIVIEGVLAGVPWYVLLLMLAIAGVDLALLVVEAIPVVGSVVGAVADTVWKANAWNVRLIRRFS